MSRQKTSPNDIYRTPQEQTDAYLYKCAFMEKPKITKRACLFGIILAVVALIYFFMALPLGDGGTEDPAVTVILLILVAICAAFSVLLFIPRKKAKREFYENQLIYKNAFEQKRYICEQRHVKEKEIEEDEVTGSEDEKILYYRLILSGGVTVTVNKQIYLNARRGDRIYEVYADLKKISPFRYLECQNAPGQYICLHYGRTYAELKLNEASGVPKDIIRKYGINSDTAQDSTNFVQPFIPNNENIASAQGFVPQNGNTAPEQGFGTIQLSDGYIRQEIERQVKDKLSAPKGQLVISAVIVAIGILLGFIFAEDFFVISFFAGISLIISLKRYIDVSSTLGQFRRDGRFWCENLTVKDRDTYAGRPRVLVENTKLRFWLFVPYEDVNKIGPCQNAVVCGVNDYNIFLIAFIIDDNGLAKRVEIAPN